MATKVKTMGALATKTKTMGALPPNPHSLFGKSEAKTLWNAQAHSGELGFDTLVKGYYSCSTGFDTIDKGDYNCSTGLNKIWF